MTKIHKCTYCLLLEFLPGSLYLILSQISAASCLTSLTALVHRLFAVLGPRSSPQSSGALDRPYSPTAIEHTVHSERAEKVMLIEEHTRELQRFCVCLLPGLCQSSAGYTAARALDSMLPLLRCV